MSIGEYIGSGAATTKLLLHLNGNSNDSSGNNRNGTDTNVSYSKNYGKFNEGANFTGSSTIYVPIVGSNIFTISCWVKVTTFANNRYIFNIKNAADNRNYGLNMTTNNVLKLSSYNGSQAPEFSTATNVFTVGTWFNVVAIINGANSKLYINSSLVKTGTLLTHISGDQLYIGSNAPYNYMIGNVDEFIMEYYEWDAVKVKKEYTNALGWF